MLYSLRLVGGEGMKEWIVESLYCDATGKLDEKPYSWLCAGKHNLEWPMTLEDCIEAVRNEFERVDLDKNNIERTWIRNVKTGETIPGAILGI